MTTQFLILRIQSVLEGSADLSDAQLRALASEYRRVCENASRKLVHCASLICAGRDYAALQVAETEPMLLESLNELIFPKIDGWRNFCAVNAIPCPPPFDNTQMELVRSLYTREISQTHPLYRDYRRAMRLKNFEGALAIIRTISKVNSANMEAKAECERLQKTVALEKFEAIKKALSNGDKTSAVKTALSIKDFADEYLYGEKIWDEVKSHIADYETAQAKERFAEILKELREIAGSGDSAKILALGAEYEIIANELGASRSRDGDDFVKSLVQKASASQKEKSEQEERAQACLELAAEIERPSAGGAALALAKIKKLKARAGKIPEGGLEKKVQKRIAFLRSKIAAKRLFWGSAAIAAAAAVSLAAYKINERQARADSLAKAESDLLALNGAPSAEELESQIERFEKNYAQFLDEPDFKNRISAKKAELESQKSIIASVSSLIEKSAAEGDPVEALEAVKLQEQNLGSLLPSDMQKTQIDINIAKLSLSKRAEQIKKENSAALKSLLSAARDAVGSLSAYTAQKADFEAARELLGRASEIADLPSKIFQAESSDAELLQELKNSLNTISSEAEALAQAKAEMLAAENLDEYLGALGDFANLPCAPQKLKMNAAKIISKRDALEKGVYKGLCDAKTAANLPEKLGKRQIDFPVGTFEIYENYIDKTPIYTRGDVSESERSWSSGKEIEQTATVISMSGAEEKRKYYSTQINGSRPRGVLLKKAGLTKESKLGKTATDIALSESPLKALEVVANSDANPVFKLWLESEILKLLAEDPINTGFAFLPKLQSRAEKTAKYSRGLNADSWMFESPARVKFIKSEFYSERAPEYQKEAQAAFEAAKNAAENPLKFAGFVDGGFNLKDADSLKPPFFGLNSDFETFESANAEDFARFSPIFSK